MALNSHVHLGKDLTSLSLGSLISKMDVMVTHRPPPPHSSDTARSQGTVCATPTQLGALVKMPVANTESHLLPCAGRSAHE